ncbi:MAG: hypothetical protein NTW13_01525, partial [Candidatus Omnitrophica bacterium]|nr:hypothetical protein [Candidatus Omnitrophota bacterium]
LSGCSSSTQPTYLKENIDQAIRNICKKEYKMDVKSRLVGSTLWVYLPLEDLVTKTEESDKNKKYTERFSLEQNTVSLKDGLLKVEYLIKAIPEQEKQQEVKYNKDALEKIRNVWKVLSRVIFSTERLKRTEPQIFCVVTADIKNGLVILETSHHLDLKKVSYGLISWDEYQHRDIQDVEIKPEIIGDREGTSLDYKNISLNEFITKQIEYRIKLKFQKPEVGKNADIDKEVLKIITNTIKTYGFNNFSIAEINNLATNNKIIMNRAAVLAKATD